MTGEDTPRYDAAGDAEVLAAPLRKWAQIGFLRGFSGIRKEIVPTGSVMLPSKAFAEVAYESLSTIPADSDEYAARHEYVQQVEEILRQRQNAFFEDHFRNSLWGHLGDVVMGLLILALGAGLMIKVGPYSPLTLILLAALGVKVFFLQFSVRRAIVIAQEAFQSRKDSIVLPWETKR